MRSSTRHIICSISLLLLGILLPIVHQANGQRIIFVNENASGTDDGSSWQNAFNSLQDALATSADGDEIWLSEGTYLPDRGQGHTVGDRSSFFEIKTAVSLYGGFAGHESARSESDPSSYPTVLSGDLNQDDDPADFPFGESRSDNANHIVWITETGDVDTEKVVRLDGLIVEGAHPLEEGGSGSAVFVGARPFEIQNSTIQNNVGRSGAGGVIHSFDKGNTIRSVRFLNNHSTDDGGALNVRIGYWKLLIKDVEFEGNYSGGSGGAIFSRGGKTSIVGSTFTGNHAASAGGAALYDESILTIWNSRFISNSAEYFAGALCVEGDDNPENHTAIIGSLFYGNRAERNGGAIFTSDQSNYMVNNTIVNNTSGSAGPGLFLAFHAAVDRVEVHNSILWGNSTDDPYETNLEIDRQPSDVLGTLLVSDSIVRGSLHSTIAPSSTVIDVDPAFADPAGLDATIGTTDDDYRLSMSSPAIDVGSSAWLPSDSLDLDQDGLTWEKLPVDLDGAYRSYSPGVMNGLVDLGAYEYEAPLVNVNIDSDRRFETGKADLQLFPNPTSGRLTVRSRFEKTFGGKSLQVSIYDLLGRRMTRYEIPTSKLQFEIPLDSKMIPSGMYTLVIEAGEEVLSSRFVVLR